MRLVIDTNDLSSDLTKCYLEESREHHIILPEEVYLESIKAGSINQILEQYDLLYHHSSQVLMAKPLSDILAIDSNLKNVSKEIINHKSTKAFRLDADQLITNGPQCKNIINHMIEIQAYAKTIFEKMAARTDDMSEYLAKARNIFLDGEIKLIGTGRPLKGATSTKMYDLAKDFSSEIYSKISKKPPNPQSEKSLLNSPLYRHSLVLVNYTIHLIGDGAKQRSSKKSHNDSIDNIVGMIGTYYNGIMTKDKLPNMIHYIVRTAIKDSGGDVPEFPFEEAFRR